MKSLTEVICEAAKEVYWFLGSGHEENVYQHALAIELRLRGVSVEQNRLFEIKYKGQEVGILFADIYAWNENEKVMAQIQVMPGLRGSLVTIDHQKAMDTVKQLFRLPGEPDNVRVLLVNFPFPSTDQPDVLDMRKEEML